MIEASDLVAAKRQADRLGVRWIVDQSLASGGPARVTAADHPAVAKAEARAEQVEFKRGNGFDVAGDERNPRAYLERVVPERAYESLKHDADAPWLRPWAGTRWI